MGKILCEVAENKTDEDLEQAMNYFDKTGRLWTAMKDNMPEIRALAVET